MRQSFAELMDPTREWALQMAGEIAGSGVVITGSLPPEREGDEAQLQVVTQRVDMGAVLKWLEVADNIEARVDRMGVRAILEDGHLTQDAILIDTSQMQVTGEVQVNFKTEEVHMVLASKAKKAQLFSLETPIKVDGKFSDFQLGTPAGDIFGTTVRFVTSPLHVPFRRLFTKAMPADGQAACTPAMQHRQ